MPKIFRTSELDFKLKQSPVAEFSWHVSENLSEIVKSKHLNFTVKSLDPGKYSYPYHFHRNSEEIFVIMFDGQIVGDIIVKDNGDVTYYLGCLCVIPDFENKGIGQKAMRFLEQEFPNAKKWSLETPADKYRNHYFYRKFGFEVTNEYMSGNVKIVLLEKYIMR